MGQGNKKANDFMALFHDSHAEVFRHKGTDVCNLLCNAPKTETERDGWGAGGGGKGWVDTCEGMIFRPGVQGLGTVLSFGSVPSAPRRGFPQLFPSSCTRHYDW